MRDFRKYKVWEQSHALVLKVYRLTNSLPVEEKYGLISQIRRAAVSIPTNIAEGCGKVTDKDFSRYINISFGSASELEYLLLLSNDLNYLNLSDYNEILEEIVAVKKQLYQLAVKLG